MQIKKSSGSSNTEGLTESVHLESREGKNEGVSRSTFSYLVMCNREDALTAIMEKEQAGVGQKRRERSKCNSRLESEVI